MEELPDLDLASMLTLLGDAVSGEVLRALDDTGLRHGHGYLVQRLVLGPATATEVAEELGVSQQAVSKAVKELVALGHVEVVTDPTDGRRRPVRLTGRGQQAVATARAARREIDGRIRAILGDEAFASTCAALQSALDAWDRGDRVRRRAARPPGSVLR